MIFLIRALEKKIQLVYGKNIEAYVTVLANSDVTELVRMILAGELTSSELTEVCLSAIDDSEEVGAWAHLDREFALKQAEERDLHRASGQSCGPLHGIPVGIKDIFDTKDFPTENGTVLDAGRQPLSDCTVVGKLKSAGAVIVGKTVTTELAVYYPGKTRNPHDLTRTPGGSSSGSAAAVASGMVPLAVGSQTNGSVIRPASFCGIFGFKPSYGTISRWGVLEQSRLLDSVGVMARSVNDLALISETLMGYDERDSAMRQQATPALVSIARDEPPVEPAIAFVKSPVWKHAEADCREAFSEIIDCLGKHCDEIDLPAPFEKAIDWHRTILCADLAKNFFTRYQSGKAQLSKELVGMIEEGQDVLAVDYNRAVDGMGILYAGLEQLFENYDAILTPAVTGEAPPSLETTGDPIFCTLWTYLGMPAVALPLLQGSNGLPIGVQLTSMRRDDGRLLRTANWLIRKVEES